MKSLDHSVLFAGGGTLGPVTPLLAVARKLREVRPDIGLVWVGTPDGPERALVEEANIPFFTVPVAKLPRYVSVQTLLFPWRWMQARRAADLLVKRIKPLAVVSVGGFTAMPVVQAAYARHVPCLTHQLDVTPGLTTKLIAKKCVSVTTSFAYDIPPFGKDVITERIPTPTRMGRSRLPERTEACARLGMDPHKRITLVIGGGTGAQALNEAVWASLDELLEHTQMIHATGVGKGSSAHRSRATKGYKVYELIENMSDVYAVADLVVCRAGLGTLSEIAACALPALVIPIPESHQEANAHAFAREEGCVVLKQDDVFQRQFKTKLLELLDDEITRFHIGERAHRVLPTDDGTAFVQRIVNALPRQE